jgi:cytochrome oxidase Cu insertion factor (SCO1/SenC/PrrC family)
VRADGFLAAIVIAAAVAGANDPPTSAQLDFIPPAPGTYDLPVVDRVRDHAIVDSSGEETTLFTLKRDRLAIVAFVYSTCPETDGCPLAQATLFRLDRLLAEEPRLANRVALVSLSFDPTRDTPERLALLRAVQRPRSDWRFVTTRGGAELQNLLADFNQSIAPLVDETGAFVGRYRHVLKLFLLDEQNRVRNVYSSGFVSAELLLADLKTLTGES